MAIPSPALLKFRKTYELLFYLNYLQKVPNRPFTRPQIKMRKLRGRDEFRDFLLRRARVFILPKFILLIFFSFTGGRTC